MSQTIAKSDDSKKESKDQESIQSSTKPDKDTNVKVTTSHLDITNESSAQDVTWLLDDFSLVAYGL